MQRWLPYALTFTGIASAFAVVRECKRREDAVDRAETKRIAVELAERVETNRIVGRWWCTNGRCFPAREECERARDASSVATTDCAQVDGPLSCAGTSCYATRQVCDAARAAMPDAPACRPVDSAPVRPHRQ